MGAENGELATCRCLLLGITAPQRFYQAIQRRLLAAAASFVKRLASTSGGSGRTTHATEVNSSVCGAIIAARACAGACTASAATGRCLAACCCAGRHGIEAEAEDVEEVVTRAATSPTAALQRGMCRCARDCDTVRTPPAASDRTHNIFVFSVRSILALSTRFTIGGCCVLVKLGPGPSLLDMIQWQMW